MQKCGAGAGLGEWCAKHRDSVWIITTHVTLIWAETVCEDWAGICQVSCVTETGAHWSSQLPPALSNERWSRVGVVSGYSASQLGIHTNYNPSHHSPATSLIIHVSLSHVSLSQRVSQRFNLVPLSADCANLDPDHWVVSGGVSVSPAPSVHSNLEYNVLGTHEKTSERHGLTSLISIRYSQWSYYRMEI